MRPRSIASTLLVPLVLSACASGGARRAGTADTAATLEVRSNYIGPIDLYAVSDNGFVQRIASAVGASRPERFRLGPGLIGGSGILRIIAVPLAENGRASTGRIVVRPGDVVQFNIAPDLAASSVFVR